MVDPIYSDVVVTWLGAAGCALYCRFLWQQRMDGATVGVSLFLFGTLAYLLFARGFYWLYETSILGQLVFAGATLLPLAIALYTERLLRRHHPFWLKMAALGAMVSLFVANLLGLLLESRVGLLVLLGALVLVCGWSGALLLRAKKEQLTLNETRRAYAMVVVAVLAVPLVATDFRTEIGSVPMRLGALAALLCIYVLLRIEHGKAVIQRLLQRLAVIAIAAGLLALVASLVILGPGEGMWQATLGCLPLALGWMLLTGIWARMAALTAEVRSNSFARWLLHARVDGAEGFLSSLRYLPLMQQHVVLKEEMLDGYQPERLLALGRSREPISLTEAREIACSEGSALQDAGEQILDLLERYQMTHALFVSEKPLQLVLVNLPEGADTVVGRLHAGVIQKLARRLSI